MVLKKTKICSACNKRKSVDKFYKWKGYKDGIRGQCKSCLKKYRKENREKIRKRHKKWYETSEREKRNIARYGISNQEYALLLQKQKGCCGICKRPASKFKMRLAIDHNHLSGQIRGLLCRECNLAIGLLNVDTNINLLLNAIVYIKSY